MLSVLANRTYRHLFAAQVIALIGTGMMTVALGLLAFKIASDKAGAVLGTALAIKMIAYVGVAPVVGGFANYLPRRVFLVSMDVTRAAVALAEMLAVLVGFWPAWPTTRTESVKVALPPTARLASVHCPVAES